MPELRAASRQSRPDIQVAASSEEVTSRLRILDCDLDGLRFGQGTIR